MLSRDFRRISVIILLTAVDISVVPLYDTENEHMFYSEELMEKSEKLKALQAAISQIEKENGKGSIMKLGDESR